jgi:hypothetical protein
LSTQEVSEKIKDDFGGRQYFLDWIRVLAFALLILYHTSMMFVNWEFHVESGYNSTFLKSIMILTSQWRLDMLFIVSGVAISFMVSKMSLKSFTWNRVIRLYIPLLFAIAVVVAPQSYYEAIQKGIFEGSFWEFWTTQYFTFSWDKRMIAPFPTYNHMWYVLYLFHYTIVLLPLFAFINNLKGKKLLSLIENWLCMGSRIIWVPLFIYLLIFFSFSNHKVNHTFYDDWYAHCIFIFVVILGLVFVRMPKVWQSFENNRYISLLIGLISYSILLTLFFLPEHILQMDKQFIWSLLGLIVKWSWIALIIGFSRRYLNFTNSTLKYCNEAIYPFFILHQTVIVVFGYYVIDWGLSGFIEYFIILVGTFIICGLLHEVLIKRVNILRILFGLKWRNNLKIGTRDNSSKLIA